jgi:hypothetical protein
METYDAKIDNFYEMHDHPELAGKSNVYISEHPCIAFPEEDRTAKKSIDNLFLI